MNSMTNSKVTTGSVSEKVHESYLIVRDDEGWKLIHPEFGPCLIVDPMTGPMSCSLNQLVFEKMIVGDTEKGLAIISDDDDIVSVKQSLADDGYSKKEIKNFKLRHMNTATFLSIYE